MILGLDIGGANTKIASSNGYARSIYFPIWKGKDLGGLLKDEIYRLEPEAVGVTLTCELADSFLSRKEGVLHISGIISDLLPEAYFFAIDGRFYDPVFLRSHPEMFFASNWLASSMFLGAEFEDLIFVDMGSTTTDIIPILSGKPRAALTDLERLKRGELIYTGILRTNVATVVDRVLVDGIPCRIASEYFAIMADVYLVLGKIGREKYTCDTPNPYASGGGKSREEASRRLARLVCSDVEELGMDRIIEIARYIASSQKNEIKDAISSIYHRYGVDLVVCGGTGEFLIREVAEELGLESISLSRRYSREISDVFPAYAISKMLEGR